MGWFMDTLKTIQILTIASIGLTFSNVYAEENPYSNTDLLLDDAEFEAPEIEEQEQSWRDNFVTTLAHEQTRNDVGDTKFLRYSVRLEYEQGFAKNWFARVDAKGTSYRSLDQQAVQRGQFKGLPAGEGESYERVLLKEGWLQYSKGSCVHKVGQQSLVWGEVDGTFTVDDITPFNFTEVLLTDYSNIRLPQAMAISECFFDKKQQIQGFYNPQAKLHLQSHNDDEYGLEALTGVDDKDLDDEFGARYKFSLGKTELALMYASLISNSPAQVLPATPVPGGPNTIPVIFEYDMYGVSLNYTSGAWQIKYDLAYKTDQVVDGTAGEVSDSVESALGFEYLTSNNHNFSFGLSGAYQLDNDFTPDQNDSTPFVTFSWSKSYLNDDLDLSLLANGNETPQSTTATTQASYQLNDYWNISGALTFADTDETDPRNQLRTKENEANLSIKFQF